MSDIGVFEDPLEVFDGDGREVKVTRTSRWGY